MKNDTLLHRQINPSFVQGDSVSSQAFIVTSQAFKPTPKDNGRLSVYNSEKFTAQKAFEHFTENYQSRGTLSVTVEECHNESLGVNEDNIPFDGHTSIDFHEFSGSAIDKKAKKLRNYAMARGWQYHP
jgi:hypothetical protein